MKTKAQTIFHEVFPDETIAASTIRQLSGAQFIEGASRRTGAFPGVFYSSPNKK